MDAASEGVTVAALDATVTSIQKPTDTFSVNQRSNNTYTPTGSNSLLSKIASNVVSNNNGGSLNIGGSSNSNSSCSSSSTSSNSSGYGSSTTTPTNSYDLQNITPTTTPIPTTTVANTEHIIPVATVAAVTPFFSEAVTAHNLDSQHHHHHAQQSQEQLQQQQQQPHALQTHHQQYSQNHLQSNLQQHHQYLSRQQYYSPYDYQQPAPTHNLSVPSATPTVSPYNMVIPGPYEMSPSSSNVAPGFATSQYKSPSSTIGSTYERSPLVKPNVTACTQPPPQQQHVEQKLSKTTTNQHFSSLLDSAKPRTSSSFISNSISTNTSKPQAAATPFYANPIPFYDNYKHKIPLEYPDAYSNSSPAAAMTYHQQQKYYVAAKSQLKEASYGSPAGLNSKSSYASTGNVFSGSTSGLNLSSTSYDKYMYPHTPASGYTGTGHFGNETPPEVTNYRKPIVGNNMNSPSWPWGIEYASGNSRSIPPPASHLPTATVAPTHATHLTQNPSVLSRDPFYVAHDKYVGKYDKYNTSSYPQTYASPTTNRHMWSNTPHGSNLTQFNERHLLAPGAPALSAHGLHTTPYFSNNHNASLSSRQTCCSQPYQTQSCYYPVSHSVQPRLAHNQNSTGAPSPPAACLPGQQTLGQSPHLNALTASCKYGGIFSDYGNVNKMKASNDLYLNAHHYDINPPPHNFGYPTAHNSQQLYNTNAHQAMTHGATPTSLLTNDPFSANPTSYTNDLNLTTSNFDNYHTHLDSHPSQQTLTGIHNTQPPPPAYGPTAAKRALLDYRKPIQPQPPPSIPEDCYPSLASRDHYNHQELLNTPETTTTFEEYEVHQNNATGQSAAALNNNSIGVAEESNKNLSLRDFIANWNDDEDEYQNNEEINFDQTAVINEVLQTAPIEQKAAAEIVTIQEVKVIKPAAQNIKDTDSPTEDIKAAEDPSVLSKEMEAGQYVNLPDIVIDVKKSNNVNSSITTPATSPTLSSPQVEVAGSSINLTDFDVEKELDELNLKKPLQQEQTKEINDTKDSKSVNTTQVSRSKSVNRQFEFEDLNIKPSTKTVLNAITTRLSPNQGSEINEQYLKDIEGYESSCSRHSNESAFEKEYETFINKITSESACPSKKGDKKPVETEKETHFDSNVQDFSKFYKRKRKLKEDNLKTSSTGKQNKKKIKTVEAIKINNSNFPQVYTKRCRNRFKIKQGQVRTHRRKPLSVFYKNIHIIRRHGPQRERRVREFMLDLKDKHLPLIKRQSIKNYTPDVHENLLIPKTLEALCIMTFNTEEFRNSLFPTIDQPQDNCLEKEEEKHICTDPTCETCEVIKSLMETENFEATLLQEATEPTTAYCTEVTKEAMAILDDLPHSNDLNFPIEEPLIMSNTIEDNQYVEENFSDLIIKPVLSENPALEKQTESFQLGIEQNTDVKNQAEIVLQAVLDNFETNFSKTDKAEAQVHGFEAQAEDPTEFVKEVMLTPLSENRIHPVAETALSFPDKSSLYCDFNTCDQIDVAVAETITKNKPLQIQNLPVSEENEGSKTSRGEISANENFLTPKMNEKYLKTKNNEESDTEDSNSSDTESESSSSETEDSSTEDSSKNQSSNSESSDIDSENELEEDKICNLNSLRSTKGEGKPTNNEATQKKLGNVFEKKAEQINCPPQTQNIANTKNMLDNEKVPGSPQRIIIRITKSLSPNEQSLRVENISAKPLKLQNEYDDHIESEVEDDQDTKKIETDFLQTQEEDFVSENPFEKRTDSAHDENVCTEKKLVTPLKLVLRGKEYLRVKSIRKSVKSRTERDNNTESESENEEISRKKSKVIKLSKTPEHENAKDTERYEFEDKQTSDRNSDKEPTHLKELVEAFDVKEKFETSTNEEHTLNGEISKIVESTDEKKKGSEDFSGVTLATNSEWENVAEDNTRAFSLSESIDQISEKQPETYLLDDNSTPKIYALQTSAINCPVQNTNEKILLEEHNQENASSSPNMDNFSEDVYQHKFLQDSEVENASSFAVLSENQDEFVRENLHKTSSIEVIETYSLTESEEETEIHSFSHSESCHGSEYDTYDDEEPLEQKNFSISKSIAVSDNDSRQSFTEVFKDQQIKTPPNLAEFRQKSTSLEKADSSSNSQFDIAKDKSEYLDCFNELNDTNETDHFVQDFSDSSNTAEADSDEEKILRSNNQNSQQEEEEEEEYCSLILSPTISKANESFKKAFSEMSELPVPADGLEEIFPKDSALVAYSHSEEEDCEILPESENVKFSNESKIVTTKANEDKNFNISEENQSPEDNFDDGRREMYTPEPRSLITEEKVNKTAVNCKEMVQIYSENDININERKETTEGTCEDQNNSEPFECKSSGTTINQSLTDTLQDVEKLLIRNDNESSPRTSPSPRPDEQINTRQIAQTETTFGKMNLSTKTKAAYKAYDMQYVIQEENVSDSEIEQPYTQPQQVEVGFSEIAGEAINAKDHNSSVEASNCSENKTKHVLEETETFKSNLPAVLDEDPDNFSKLNDIKDPTSDISPANEMLNEVEEIKKLEDKYDETTKKITGISSEETNTNRSLAVENICIDNIENNLKAVSINNVDVNTSSQDINETTFDLTKDSHLEEEETLHNYKNSFTTNCLDSNTVQTSTTKEDNYENANISREAEDQSVGIDIENKNSNIYSECEKLEDCEDFESSKTETFCPSNKIEVVKEDASTVTAGTTNLAQESLESAVVVIEDISKSAIEKEKIIELSRNSNKQITQSVDTSNEKETEEEFFETEEREHKLRTLNESPEFLEKSKDVVITFNERKPFKDVNEANPAEIKLEDAKTPEDTSAQDIEINFLAPFDARDEVANEGSELVVKQMEESSNRNCKSDQTSEDGEFSGKANADDHSKEKIGGKELISESGKKTEDNHCMEESLITTIERDLISENENLRKDTEMSEVNKDTNNEENELKENNIKDSSISTGDLDVATEFKYSKIEGNQAKTNEALELEEKEKLLTMDSTIEREKSDLRANPIPIERSRSPYKLNRISKNVNEEENNEYLNVEEKITKPEKIMEQIDLGHSCILFKEKSSLEVQSISKDGVKENGNDEIFQREGSALATIDPEKNSKDHDLNRNLIPNNKMDFTSEPALKEFKQISNVVVNDEKIKPDKETDLQESSLQEAHDQELETESFSASAKQCSKESDAEVSLKPTSTSEELIKEKDAQQTLNHNNSQLQEASEESKLESRKENSDGTANPETLDNPYITPEELSADFYGFKNQSSFEDESEDFHGFEDLEEVARIRQEIENLRDDDSAANDGFLNNLALNRAVHKTSTASLNESTNSEINEMEALEKELSQHQLEMEGVEEDKGIENELQTKALKIVSTNDIEHIKQMLESDEEPQNDAENKLEMMAHTSNNRTVKNKNVNVSNDRLSSLIPKLSDLCRAALNSSLSSSSNLAQQHIEKSTVPRERELSVEEALAEMYRQAGVLLSDSDDCDNDITTPDDTESHDVLLINLQEILNNDSNDVYVLQCDMNKNVLNVVQPTGEHGQEESLQIDDVNTERVNTVKIILDTQNSEPQIHIISSDSESEVIILSDDDSEISYRPFKAREESVTIPFINDEEINTGDDNLFDISTIHHEEIVPDNLTKFLRDEFYKYLHEKYVQRSISKYYHAHRILKKYKRRLLRRQ